jgi:hypothetical protein
LEVHWSHIGVHANTTPEASLRSHFILALEKDPLAIEYRDNPPETLVMVEWIAPPRQFFYVPHDDALRVELMHIHHHGVLQ